MSTIDHTEDQGAPYNAPDNVVRGADFLRALANPHRLMILSLLQQKKRTVMEICEILQLRQSLVSQHLARLRLDGVVKAERQGHYVIYSLGSKKALMIINAVLNTQKD